MAELSSQEQNFVSRIIADAADMLKLRTRLELDIALYNQKSYLAKLDDVSLAAAFNGLTADELINGITALITVTDALGDNSSGQAVNLIKLAVGR